MLSIQRGTGTTLHTDGPFHMMLKTVRRCVHKVRVQLRTWHTQGRKGGWKRAGRGSRIVNTGIHTSEEEHHRALRCASSIIWCSAVATGLDICSRIEGQGLKGHHAEPTRKHAGQQQQQPGTLRSRRKHCRARAPKPASHRQPTTRSAFRGRSVMRFSRTLRWPNPRMAACSTASLPAYRSSCDPWGLLGR